MEIGHLTTVNCGAIENMTDLSTMRAVVLEELLVESGTALGKVVVEVAG